MPYVSGPMYYPNLPKITFTDFIAQNGLQRLHKIASGGCLFVAIGAKESLSESLEWRISFSKTERILIHSMNHVQFLCYGLLKIFLKEVIDVNTDVKGLLCSYFLKTALFWEITNGNVIWNIHNFMSGFWACFKRLLHWINWINNKYCPNFFIPENNMFAGKITDQARIKLLCCLLPLYKEEYHCLLRCPSLQNNLQVFIERPMMAADIETDEVDKSKLNLELTREIFHWKLPLRTKILQSDKVIQDLDRLISENDRELEREVLNIWKNETHQNAQLSRPSDVDSIINSPTDATSHLLYAALYNYQDGRFDAALQFATEAKTKLHGPWVQYPWQPSVARYKAAGGDNKSFTEMTRETVAWPIDLTIIFRNGRRVHRFILCQNYMMFLLVL